MITKRIAASAIFAAAAASTSVASAASLPAIQAGPSNLAPACATPGRLMAFIRDRNPRIDPKFADVSLHYMTIGSELGMRWDYAFFQMLVETGFLSFGGDVKPHQNNFAGIGATGNGAPGESFPSVAEGVRAHLQHLLMYAGVHVDDPVAERTRKVQAWRVLDDWRRTIRGPVSFDQMTRKWSPGDRGYAGDIKAVADRFLNGRCLQPDPAPEMIAGIRRSRPAPSATVTATGPQQGLTVAQRSIEASREAGYGRSGLGMRAGNVGTAAPNSLSQSVSVINRPAAGATPPAADTSETARAPDAEAPATETPAIGETSVGRFASNLFAAMSPTASPAPTAKPKSCRVWTASYGGQKALIIRSINAEHVNYTVLDVNEGREKREADAYIAAYAKGGETVETHNDPAKALKRAFELCPDGNKKS